MALYPRIQEFEADAHGSQRDGEAALQGRGSGIRGFAGHSSCFEGKEDMYARDGLHLNGKGAAVFAEGLLIGAVASGLGKVSYLN